MKIVKTPEELRGNTNSALGMRKQKIVSLPKTTVNDDTTENMHLLEECQQYWDSLRDFRMRRMRNRKYYRGDQWSDEIYDAESRKYIKEEEYIKSQGKVPLKQNQIRQLMKNLIGQFESNPSQTIILSRSRENATQTEMLTNAMQVVHDNNLTESLDARLFEEFGLSGAIIQRLNYRYFKNRNLEDVYIENVNPTRVFFNTDVSDIRLDDLRLIGVIIDTNVDDLVSIFAKSQADEEKIRQIYASLTVNRFLSGEGLTTSRIDNLDFYIPQDINKARLFEVWYLKGAWKTYAHDPMDGSYSIVHYSLQEIAEQNRERIKLGEANGIPQEEIPLIEAEPKYEQAWFVKFLTPTGHCLYERETPYKHEEHPFAITLYPLLDGEVWGFVEDIIDQQRYINRLIILMDFIISASAKGVLMVPEDTIPDGMTLDEIADEWTKFNGVILFKPKPHGLMPEQISSKSTNIGITEMLSLQMSLIQNISGVHGAIQGKEAVSGKPSSLYAQEAQNAMLNTLDYMHTFENFQQKRDFKILKLITQYYQDKRYLAINGRFMNEEAKLYDPDLVKNLDFTTKVTKGQDTPVYRQLMDDTLMNLLDKQFIDIEMFLEHTSLPYADKLLASIRQQKEQIMQQGTAALPPEVAQQLNTNPAAMNMAKQFIGMK